METFGARVLIIIIGPYTWRLPGHLRRRTLDAQDHTNINNNTQDHNNDTNYNPYGYSGPYLYIFTVHSVAALLCCLFLSAQGMG